MIEISGDDQRHEREQRREDEGEHEQRAEAAEQGFGEDARGRPCLRSRS